MTDDKLTMTLPNGNTLELYEPAHSGDGPMQSGYCPGCRNGLSGYLGRCATIRELNAIDQPVWGEYTTNYGHYDCVASLYERVTDRINRPNEVNPVHLWTTGTQREMVLYVQRRGLEDRSCTVRHVPNAPRERRYEFFTNPEETE